MTRLQTFRAFIAAMNPSSNPAEALRQGFYVEPPSGGVCSALTKKLELEPGSTHLVLGGIGSGKTTELLRTTTMLRESLDETGDFVRYCDVSNHHDLTETPQVGVLFALTGLYLIDSAKRKGVDLAGSSVESAVQALVKFADGFSEEIHDDPYDDRDEYDEHYEHEYEPPTRTVIRPGVLKAPPSRPLHWRLAMEKKSLEAFLNHFPGPPRAAIMLFDSLDRLPQAATFQQLVEEDIRVLKSLGIGLVVVGPARFIVGTDRGLTDLFDHVHFQLSTDPQIPAGEAFLCEVLRRRTASSGLLPEESLQSLAQASGGVLRDLITLAKLGAEQAYANGHPKITLDDVARASDTFGRSLAIGIDDDQLKILRAVVETGSFVVRGERELSLLETRRVLMYEPNRWAVHPALRGLIENIPETGG